MKPFSTLYLVVVFTALLSLTSCKNFGEIELDGACDAGKESVYHSINLTSGFEIEKFVHPLQKGNILYYQDYGDSIRFIIYQPQTNICTKEHFNVDFEATVKKDPPTPITVFGEVTWSAFGPPAQPIFKKIGSPGTDVTYIGTAEAGLYQTFKEKAGEVDSFLTIQFESQGSQLKNIDYLREYMLTMKITYTYSKHAR